MNFPVYFWIGGTRLHPHWIFEGLAYLVGIGCVVFARRRSGDLLDARSRWVLVGAALAGGFIGGRLLSLAEDPGALTVGMLTTLAAGKTIVGGLAGGLLAVEGAKRLLHIEQPTGDLITLPLIAGIAIGRIGCFLSGLEDQSYGIATSLPWGVDFGDGVRRHPTQLYEVAFLGALGAMILSRGDRLTRTGDRFKVFLIAYAGFRLLVDVIKPGVRIGGLSAIQWACAGVLAFYAPHAKRLAAALFGPPVRTSSGGGV
jgi:prolipoprotein diacylglyceryltransferase